MSTTLYPEHERLIAQVVQSGAFENAKEVLDWALRRVAEDIEDNRVSDAREHEPRSTLAEIEAELRGLGTLK